jgi:hypothetical protein
MDAISETPHINAYQITKHNPGRGFTLTLQKSRMPQVQGVEGEAVVCYAEPLRTQEMRYHRLSRRVNNMAGFSLFVGVTPSEPIKRAHSP